MEPGFFILIGFIVAFFFLIGFRIAQEYERSLIFRLGRFVGTRGPGLFWIIPFFERQQKVDIRTRTVNLEPQETITKDSVTIKVNAVLWFRVTKPAQAVLRVENFSQAVYQLSVTTLRNILGQYPLDEIIRERETINKTLQQLVDASTEPWGIKIEMVEMKDVEIPVTMQRAMAREAEAMREKRARIIKAEAELEASEKLTLSAERMAATPAALELRRIQMLSEIGIDNNTTTVIMMPADFQTAAKSFTDYMSSKK